MPLPPLIVPLAIGGGWLFKKGAEAYAKRVHSKANNETNEAISYIEEQKTKYMHLRKLYLTRLLSYSRMIKAMIGDGPVNIERRPDTLPPSFQKVWDDIKDQDGVFAPYESIDFGLMNSSDERKFAYVAGMAVRQNPNAAPAIAVAVGAQQVVSGTNKILNSNKHLTAVKGQANSIKQKADKVISSLNNQYELLSVSWDDIVIPNIHMATNVPRNESAIEELRSFAIISEKIATEILREHEADDQ